MIKKMYEFNAEHFDRPTATKLVRELEADGIEVEHATTDGVFSNELLMVVTCTDAQAKATKNRIWAKNNGAYCDMFECSQERLETYL